MMEDPGLLHFRHRLVTLFVGVTSRDEPHSTMHLNFRTQVRPSCHA